MQQAQAPLPVGTVIYEHYMVESLLGHGDFGKVYLVRDQQGKRELFAFAEVSNPTKQAKYRFALDYVSLAPLEPGSLPDVQYVFHHDRLNQAAILMQHIQEPHLELLRSQEAEKRFLWEKVMAIMMPVMQAVSHLHHRSPAVFHGNIQPANILVSKKTNAPVLVMLDMVREQEASNTRLPYFADAYAAPEQYNGETSIGTDIYGLGATWYTLLTGIIPPTAPLRSTLLNDPFTPITEILSALPASLAEAIGRAMALKPEDRFTSVEQFCEVIGSLERSALPAIDHALPLTPIPTLAPFPKLADTPYPEELNGFHQQEARQVEKGDTPLPEVSPAFHEEMLRQGDESLFEQRAATPVSVPKQPAPRRPWRAPSTRKPAVALMMLALLGSMVFGASFLLRMQGLPLAHSALSASTGGRATSTPVPIATPEPSSYPRLAATYMGTIGDVSNGVSTSISLTAIHQSQGHIIGYLSASSHVLESGPFKGTITTAKHVQFIVTDVRGNALFFFEGDMRSGNGLTGDYYRCIPDSRVPGDQCSQASGSYGIWDVVALS